MTGRFARITPADPEVASLTDNLRQDADLDSDARATHADAAEQAGTGSDR